jgi:hypothetical protein
LRLQDQVWMLVHCRFRFVLRTKSRRATASLAGCSAFRLRSTYSCSASSLLLRFRVSTQDLRELIATKESP